MSHKHKHKSPHKKVSKSREWLESQKKVEQKTSEGLKEHMLEIVLKCESDGSLQAVSYAIQRINLPSIDIHVIYSGIGDINHSDVLMAATGSRLIVGYQVSLIPGIEKELHANETEARLYNIIYELTDDIRNIASQIGPAAPEEEITGSAKIIALFKSVRKGIIIGCEITEGTFAVGKHFRIISAMGPVYSGVVQSMHIEKDAVQKATAGQKVGIKIRDFNKPKVGDIVETFKSVTPKRDKSWHPKGDVIKGG